MLAKPLFVMANGSAFAHLSACQIWLAVIHGIPMDCAVAGYFTMLPALWMVISPWFGERHWWKVSAKVYFWIIGSVISLALALDAALYSFWDFKLDATPVFYFLSSPKSAIASVSWEFILIGIVGIAILAVGISKALIWVWNVKWFEPLPQGKKRLWMTGVYVLAAALLIIPIRGGVTVSTMNLSSAYFSQDARLNHAAVNPLFSFIYSVSHQTKFADQYHYTSDDEAREILANFEKGLASAQKDSIPELSLTTPRPDIYFIILESFSSHLFPSIGGESVALALDSIAREGVVFQNFYANSFRTDRGLTAILSAYPGMPSTSIMKFVEKTDNLPSLPKTLKENGYDLEYYYGGDINFTNMNAFLRSAGFESIVKDTDFPVEKRLSKWGVHDDVLLAKAWVEISRKGSARPVFRVIQTSSSHEPFKVPYSNPAFSNERANAFAYTDNEVAEFIRNLKESGSRWDKSLVILVSDHYGCYPENLEEPALRHRIPLILTGGALRASTRMISVFGSQIDLTATLLGMLGIQSSDFPFSKDMRNPEVAHYAFFCNPDYAGIATHNGVTTIDVKNCDGATGGLQSVVKAYLQLLHRDFDNR